MKKQALFSLILAVLALAVFVRAQRGSTAHQHDPAATSAELDQATQAMSMENGAHHSHFMGPHMFMSTLRPPQPAEQQRADHIVKQARVALEKYKDVKYAESEGYKIFMPEVKQKMYHFTNWKYAIKASFTFNPAEPTSLLYEKSGADQFKLIGAMYTAPARYSEDQINERVPLSVAQWHKHVNLCIPPKDKRDELWGKNARFGLQGSIANEEECDAAGGRFMPVVFGWMVHLYPYETTSDAIWSVERQKNTVEMGAAQEHHH